MRFWIKILKVFHRHRYKPILSKYVSFNTRDIIWECRKCGKRISEREFSPFDIPFSKETDYNVSYKFYNQVLNGEKNPK